MSDTTIDSKGAVVIPSWIRRRLRIKPGDKIRFRETKEGSVIIEPENDLLDLKGIFDPKGIHLTVERMDEISAKAAVDKK